MTNPSISRRQFFRGDIGGKQAPPRPPWAILEASFTATCDRCGDCIDACPEQIVLRGDGGFPFLDFTVGGCSFCAECLNACAGKALRGDPQRDAPWALSARIDDGCLGFRGVICRSCAEACEAGAIRFRPRVGGAPEPMLSAVDCTGCGHCVRVCPAQAVTVRVPGRAQMGTAA